MSYLTAKKTIKFLDLNPDKCCYLLERDYPIESTQSPFAIWKAMDALDTFLMDLTEQEAFEIFYTQSSTSHFYVIISNPKCKGYSFIEGGLGCYKPEYKKLVSNKPSLLKDLFYAFMYKGRVPNQKFFFNTKLPGFKYCVGTNEHAFKAYDNPLNVGSPFEDKAEYRSIKHVYVIDCVVEFYNAKMQTIEAFTETLFERLKKENAKEVYFKLHPEHYRQEGLREKYLEVVEKYSGDIKAIELDKSVILEHIARSSEATFYVNISSVGLYANLLGREVWSFARMLHKLEPHMDITYKELGTEPIHYF